MSVVSIAFGTGWDVVMTTSCAFETCEKLSEKRGWCNNHYQKWRRCGDPAGVNRSPNLPMLDAFRHYMPDDPPESGCWEWSGRAFHEFGYGLIQHAGKLWRTHCMSYELFNGPTAGKQVRHTCDNPPCVQPKHLVLGTQLDNMRDKVARGRQPNGNQIHTSKLSRQEIIEIRRRYAVGDITQHELANTYNISQHAIGAITRHMSWKHVG